ncbi:MAG: hypothetical protein K8W52_46510 [Deltaproteobacteria bacterium]|nr:hypothetical protein [Deltaproteobacteria bacterium]
MGDAFVDVTYRGLEVGRRLRIRAFSRDAAYVEAPLPLPVGTPLELAIDNGMRIAAVVARVHEQVGGSDRVPGMRVRPTLDDAARAWWEDAVASWPEGVPSTDEVTRPMRVSTAPPLGEPRTIAAAETRPAAGALTEVITASRPGAVVEITDDDPAVTVPYNTPVPVANVPVQVAVVSDATAPASAESGPIVDDDTGTSQRMPAIDDGQRTQLMPAMVPPPDDDAPGDELKRTTVMAAVDIEAILAAGETGGGEDDEPEIEVSSDADASNSGSMPAAGGAKGKKRAQTKRKKQRK